MISKCVVSGVAVAWEALFVYDLLIVSLTLAKGYKDRARHPVPGGDELMDLIVRDGEPSFDYTELAGSLE